MPCGNERRADLPCVAQQAARLRASVVVLVPLLLVGCPRRSRAEKSDFDITGGDSFPLVLFRYFGDHRDGVSQGICVK
jgi:hypothetical protein